MSDEPRGGGARLMIGFDGRTPTDDLKRVLHETGGRSVILFARNLDGAGQARDLIAGIRDLVPWNLMLAVDQEGGAVVRLVDGITVFPGNMALAATEDIELGERVARESGRQLSAIGFDMNLAPVMDLQTNPANPGIGIRSFGTDGEWASVWARAWIRGHAEFGVRSCVKHFPGKGEVTVDAHEDLPIMPISLDEIRFPHAWAFEQVINVTEGVAVMSSHFVIQEEDPETPVTFLPVIVRDLLRDEMAFAGLVISDDLEMGAIKKRWSMAEAALRAAQAGHDLMPICHDSQAQLQAAKRLDEALGSGELDAAEHDSAVNRIIEYTATAQGGDLVDTADGDAAAIAVSRACVHVFGDDRGLLPIPRDASIKILAARPHGPVLLEPDSAGDWAGVVGRSLGGEVIEFDVESADATALVDRCDGADRVVLLTWSTRQHDGMRAVLDEAASRCADRLIVAHARNPFDQDLVPEGITALTAWGFRRSQLEALGEVLAGRLEAKGIMPAMEV